MAEERKIQVSVSDIKIVFSALDATRMTSNSDLNRAGFELLRLCKGADEMDLVLAPVSQLKMLLAGALYALADNQICGDLELDRGLDRDIRLRDAIISIWVAL